MHSCYFILSINNNLEQFLYLMQLLLKYIQHFNYFRQISFEEFQTFPNFNSITIDNISRLPMVWQQFKNLASS